jgi:hypothetical protein
MKNTRYAWRHSVSRSFPFPVVPFVLRTIRILLPILLVILFYRPGQTWGADGSREAFQNMESSLAEISVAMKKWADDYRNKGVVPPPDLSGELRRLERHVDYYIKTYETTTAPLKNPLKTLELDQKGLSAEEDKQISRALKNITTMRDVYQESWEKFRKKHKQTAYILTGKGMIDVLGLVAIFDKIQRAGLPVR